MCVLERAEGQSAVGGDLREPHVSKEGMDEVLEVMGRDGVKFIEKWADPTFAVALGRGTGQVALELNSASEEIQT
jgi:hypothetical protein